MEAMYMRAILRGGVASGLLLVALAGCSRGDSASGTSGQGGSNNVATSSSKTVGAAGGSIVLPNLATVFVPPGSTGTYPIIVEAMTSEAMDDLAPEATPGFEFFPGVPKFRIRLPQQPTEMIELVIAIPNLATVLPATHTLVVVMGMYSVESDDEEPSMVLSPIVGEACEDNTAVCVTLLPGWFADIDGTGTFQVQVGAGRVPSGVQPVAFQWWDKFFGTALAIAQEAPWRLWTVSGLTPTGQTVAPDGAHILHVSGTVTLSDNIPVFASPLPGALTITSDFGPREVTTNKSASNFHTAVDLRADEGTDVFPVMDGEVLDASNLARDAKGKLITAKCTKPTPHSSTPLKRTRVKSGQLIVSYLHLSETSSDPQKIGKSGNSGSCDPHLDLRVEFTDEFGGKAFIDPWPLLRDRMDRFVNSDGDSVTAECSRCREVFPFQFVLDLVGGRLKQPGGSPLTTDLYPNFITWPAGQISHTLDGESGQFSLLSYEDLVTTGQYSLRLRICSKSIGGCRQVRTWKIIASTCPDPTPNLTAHADIVGTTLVNSKTQPGPISVSISNSFAQGSASGTKGNVSLSTSGSNFSGAGASMNYQDTLLITSDGKTGVGQATIAWQLNTSISSLNVGTFEFQESGETILGRIMVGNTEYGRYDEPNSTTTFPPMGILDRPANVTFTYGTPFSFTFDLLVRSRSFLFDLQTASASASGGYSVTVSGDPNAVVTWCRGTQ